MIDLPKSPNGVANRIVRATSRPNVKLDFVRPVPVGNLYGTIDPAKPETDPARRTLVAHDLDGEREISVIFKDNPTTLVIISPSEMVFRADWQNRK
jgi:hypothetical protein